MILWWIGIVTAQLTDFSIPDHLKGGLSRKEEADIDFLFGKIDFTEFSDCKTIDSDGNQIRYRHHCDEGVFTVEVHACNDLGDPWVVRFDSLDRLGGCINILEGEGQAQITTIVGKCGTEYYKENGYVYLNNRLHIFRSVEDEVFNYNSYSLSCEYEETMTFEYDLSGVSTEMEFGLNVRFWETAVYQHEIKNLDFQIGEQIYLSFEWYNVTAGLSYAIKECALRDKTLQEEYAMVKNGCVSTLVSADRHSQYFEKTKNSQYFEFLGFSFPNSLNFLTLKCRIKMCLNNNKGCQLAPEVASDCDAGYQLASGRPAKRLANP
jgi:hypothetical protein